jgi:hypothetical protein
MEHILLFIKNQKNNKCLGNKVGYFNLDILEQGVPNENSIIDKYNFLFYETDDGKNRYKQVIKYVKKINKCKRIKKIKENLKDDWIENINSLYNYNNENLNKYLSYIIFLGSKKNDFSLYEKRIKDLILHGISFSLYINWDYTENLLNWKNKNFIKLIYLNCDKDSKELIETVYNYNRIYQNNNFLINFIENKEINETQYIIYKNNNENQI